MYAHRKCSKQIAGAGVQVHIACQDTNRVLIWSFNDCLAPKLVLECPREVKSISVCPLDGAIIVGGCVNGQVIRKF